MTTEESAKFAQQTWEACQPRLGPGAELVVLADDPAPLKKSDTPRMRLRLRPKKKSPLKFWGGWTWYEINVGHMPDSDSGLNLGSVAFMQSPGPKESGGGAYARATIDILRCAEETLGSPFSFKPSAKEGDVISLHRIYPASLKSFPSLMAGEDLARLISSTLPLLLKIPNTIS